MDIPLKEGRGNDDYSDKIHVKDRHKGDKNIYILVLIPLES